HVTDDDARFAIELVGANPEAAARPEEPAAAQSHYFRGPREKWLVGIPHFGRVAFDGVYPGIDVVYYGHGPALEYDFHVAPSADARTIRLRLRGADGLRLGRHGDALVRVGAREIRYLRPSAYQETASGRQTVAVRYVRRGPRDLGLALGPHDRTRAVVI